MTSWLESRDHVLLNEIESCGLAAQPEVEAAAGWLRRQTKPDAAIVIKRGPLASLHREAPRDEAGAPRIEVVDTIGAGDVFHAGLSAQGHRWRRFAQRDRCRSRRGLAGDFNLAATLQLDGHARGSGARPGQIGRLLAARSGYWRHECPLRAA